MTTAEADVFAALRSQLGEEIGLTDWMSITQEEADQFGNLTDDWDPMHNDPEWGRNGPWGQTIAHGFHQVALISAFLKHAVELPILTNERAYTINYGLDKVRFLSPLPIGRRFRSRITLTDIQDRSEKEILVKTRHTVEVEGQDKPSMIADSLVLCVTL